MQKSTKSDESFLKRIFKFGDLCSEMKKNERNERKKLIIRTRNSFPAWKHNGVKLQTQERRNKLAVTNLEVMFAGFWKKSSSEYIFTIEIVYRGDKRDRERRNEAVGRGEGKERVAG